jgi:predicted GIY-YIG superfamily endonuclease
MRRRAKRLIMYYIYILQSTVNRDKIYTGLSTDIKKRMQSHNSGANSYSNKFKPWKLIWFCGFANRNKAIAFEKYLKTASGIAFKRKRLIVT